MRINFNSRPAGSNSQGPPMGFTGQDMTLPGGGMATTELQQRWIIGLLSAFYGAHGSITLNELRVMLCIVEAGDRGAPMSPSNVGYSLDLRTSTVSRIVSRLVKRGVVTSKRSAKDHRRKVLLATPMCLEQRKKKFAELSAMMKRDWGWVPMHGNSGSESQIWHQ